jgi:hypothetical protein
MQSCFSCEHQSQHTRRDTRTCLQPIAAGLLTEADGFQIIQPPQGYAMTCRAWAQRSESLNYLPPVRDPDRGSLTEPQIKLMAARIEVFERHSWDYERASRWADHLQDRDACGDERRLCVECANLSGMWSCMENEAVLSSTLQRCPKFELNPILPEPT